MASPNVGSCVGVLYKVNGEGLPQVHNGKLLSKTPNSILVQHFTLKTIKNGPNKGKQVIAPNHFTFFTKKPKNPPSPWFQLIDARKTPNFSPEFCKPSTGKGTVIGSGSCIGIRFKTPITKTKQDVKNGKFLYAVDQNGNKSCTVDTSKPLPKKVVYMHWNWSEFGAKSAVLVPETASRTNPLEIRRNPSKFITE